MEVSSHALDQGQRGRHPVRRGRLHEPESRAPRLPRHDGGATSTPRPTLFENRRGPHAAVMCVDDPWGRILAARHRVPTVEVATPTRRVDDGDVGRTAFRWRIASRPRALARPGQRHERDACARSRRVLGVDLATPSRAVGDVPPVPGGSRSSAAGHLRPGRLRAHARRIGAGAASDVRALRPAGAARRRLRVRGRAGPREEAGDGLDRERAGRRVVMHLGQPAAARIPSRHPRRGAARCHGPPRSVRDRSRAGDPEAIARRARMSDVVVLAGKGHETTQEVAGEARRSRRPHRRRRERSDLQERGVLSIMEAGCVALFFAILLTPVLIRSLRRRSIGQQIREELGLPIHVVKAGTPTMGGFSSSLAARRRLPVGHVGGYRTFTRSGDARVLAVVVASGSSASPTISLGIRQRAQPRAQQAGQVRTARCSSPSASPSRRGSGRAPRRPSRSRGTTCRGGTLGPAVWVVFAAFVVVATSNAVNLTDGLEGSPRARPPSASRVLGVIGYWQFRHFAHLPRGRPCDSTSASSRSHSSAGASDSSGGTQRRRRSSWATRVRSPSAPASRGCAC